MYVDEYRYFKVIDTVYVGPFIFGLEAAQEGLQSKFCFITSCARYSRSWTIEKGKVIEIGCGKGERNANKAKEVATEQERFPSKARRPYLSYIYGMNMIVKGFSPCCSVRVVVPFVVVIVNRLGLSSETVICIQFWKIDLYDMGPEPEICNRALLCISEVVFDNI